MYITHAIAISNAQLHPYMGCLVEFAYMRCAGGCIGSNHSKSGYEEV
jgi:hypothetical protein